MKNPEHESSKNLWTRRDWLAAAGLFSLSAGMTRCGRHGRRQPNIVIIFTDDQGYADLGCYGARGFSTPHLDRMAEEGMRFTDFYSASPGCSPSRAALLTGCYPQRVGIPGVLAPHSRHGLNPDEFTMADMLKQRGYATSCIGKWHLGDHPSLMPWNHGFDEYYGLPYSNDYWPWQYGEWPGDPRRKPWPDLPLYDNWKVAETNPHPDTLTYRYTERALQFIRRNRDNPFFLYLAHSMPHTPLGVSSRFRDRSAYGRYGDVIMEIDWSAGQILRTLKELDLDRDTLVIFTSDNGPWLPFGNHAGSTGPLREGKGTTFEGGMRMPCIMRWPGRIPRGQTCGELATTMDLLPTIASLTGTSLIADRIIDGKNIASLIMGKPDSFSPHEAFFYHWPAELQAVRQGKWKLHFPHTHRHQAGSPGQGGLRNGETQVSIGLSLFNLETDIGETLNVAGDHPDIVARLTELGRRHESDLARNSRPAARVEWE